MPRHLNRLLIGIAAVLMLPGVALAQTAHTAHTAPVAQPVRYHIEMACTNGEILSILDSEGHIRTLQLNPPVSLTPRALPASQGAGQGAAAPLIAPINAPQGNAMKTLGTSHSPADAANQPDNPTKHSFI